MNANYGTLIIDFESSIRNFYVFSMNNWSLNLPILFLIRIRWRMRARSWRWQLTLMGITFLLVRNSWFVWPELYLEGNTLGSLIFLEFNIKWIWRISLSNFKIIFKIWGFIILITPKFIVLASRDLLKAGLNDCMMKYSILVDFWLVIPSLWYHISLE